MFLATNVHVAHFGDRAVILDEMANRYRLLGHRQARVLADVAAGRAPDDPAAERALVGAGILDLGRTWSPGGPLCPAPTDSALERASLPASGWSGFDVARASIAAVLRLRFERFSAVLDWARATRTEPRVAIASLAERDDVVAAAQAFDRLRSLVPLQRICLRDSLALFVLLKRAGHNCQLVFGVRLDPFEAHCWVQFDRCVLSDRIDHIRQMRPLLAI